MSMRQLQFRSMLPFTCLIVKLDGSAWELGWIGVSVQAATCDLETSFAAQGKIKASAAVNSSRRHARKPHPPVTHLFVVCAVSNCRRRRSLIRRLKALNLSSCKSKPNTKATPVPENLDRPRCASPLLSSRSLPVRRAQMTCCPLSSPEVRTAAPRFPPDASDHGPQALMALRP